MQETNFFWLTLYCRWPWVQMMKNQQCSDSGPGDGEWCRNFLFYLFLSGTHCGFVLPPVLISVGNNMSLSFQSDSRLADRGFSATWEAVYPEDLSGKTPYIYSHLHTPRMNPADSAVNQKPSATLCVMRDFQCMCPLWIFWSRYNEGRIAMQNNIRKRTVNIILPSHFNSISIIF